MANFLQLPQREGDFLITKEKRPSFSWADLKGKTNLEDWKGGIPEKWSMNLYSNKKGRAFRGLTIEQEIYVPSTAAAFTEGKEDYTVEFASSHTPSEQGKSL